MTGGCLFCVKLKNASGWTHATHVYIARLPDMNHKKLLALHGNGKETVGYILNKV